MNKISSDNFIEKYPVYHRTIYALMVLSVILSRFVFKDISNQTTFVVCSIFVLFFLADIFLYALEYFNSQKFFIFFKYIQILIYSGIQGCLIHTRALSLALTVYILLESVEYIMQGAEYDTEIIKSRKTRMIFPMLISCIAAFTQNSEVEWFAYFVFALIYFFVLNSIVDWFYKQQVINESICTKLRVEKSQIESNNTKLIEYQEKVKNINELINYQKIDLTKANKGLEQVNREIQSLTEVMKYMTSNLDVLKCVNVLTDAIMEIKNPKLCAMYIDKDVYINQFGSCIIKTNYSSMQRRLKKEIESIFEEVSTWDGQSRIMTGEDLRQFKFIGDANINVLVVFPIMDGDRIYGMMIVGSDDGEFFESGLGYYENCIVEFNVAVNSTKMYLQMQDMARKDGLTGIYNRIYFNELFRKTITDIKRRKKPISVALFDIDKFKNVNDTYGHLAGDLVIQTVAI